jgi:hypothetical protein
MGLIHRFKCARIGHYWADNGTGRGVCVRCGRHGHPVSRRAPYVSDDDSQHLEPVALTRDEVSDIPTVTEVSDIPAVAVAAEDAGTDQTIAGPDVVQATRRGAPAGKTAAVTLAVVSLAVFGGATYLAFRRHKRASR